MPPMYKKGIFTKTKRLVLRPMLASDYKKWQAYCLEQTPPKNEWDRKYRLFKKATLSEYLKKIKKYSDNAKNDRAYNFGVFTKDGKLIGDVCIMHIQRGAFQMGVVGCVLSNLYWSSGYGKEALRALIHNGFKKLKLHRIEGMVEKHNRRSLRLVKSVGMRHEGLSRKYLYVEAKWMDSIRYSNTCEDYGIKWKP